MSLNLLLCLLVLGEYNYKKVFIHLFVDFINYSSPLYFNDIL